MSSTDQVRSDFSRYAQLIEPLLRSNSALPDESADTVQIGRGIMLAQALLREGEQGAARLSSPKSSDRLIELAHSPRLAEVKVIDASGHQRPVYRPLLIYAWLLAFRVRYETLSPEQFGRWDESLRAWSDLLETDLARANLSEPSIPAARGGETAAAAWAALALHVAGKIFIRDAWTDLASDTFGRLTRAQQPGGSFLLASASDHPEVTWYHELAILHAAASYAVQAEDRPLARLVAKSSMFHLNEIQPDHATSQPWGMFAFIWNPPARSLADQMLHSVSLHPPDGASLILLADALYCLQLFL